MSASITSGTYPRRAEPSTLLAGWRRALWRALLRYGQRRAVPHLLALARQHEHTDPALAAQLRAAAQHPSRD